MTLEEARARAQQLLDDFAEGRVSFSDLAEAQAKVTELALAQLVDDPFAPGRQVRPSMARIYPTDRMAVAVERRFSDDKAKRAAKPKVTS